MKPELKGSKCARQMGPTPPRSCPGRLPAARTSKPLPPVPASLAHRWCGQPSQGHTEEQGEGSRYPRLWGKKRRQTGKEKVWERQAGKGSKNTQDKTTDTNKGSRPLFQGIKHAAQDITRSQNTAFDFSLRYKKRKKWSKFWAQLRMGSVFHKAPHIYSLNARCHLFVSLITSHTGL